MMEKKSKKELLQHIEDQNETLNQYKSRLHDVVGSYKRLVKEKEALDVSVQILTESSASVGDSKKTSSEICLDSDEQPDSALSKKDDFPSSLQALKTSLRTLTAEKSRIESDFKTDRKKLLREKDDLQKQVNEMENNWKQDKDKFQIHIQELKRQIRDQQNDREKEQQVHVLMLKEMQSLVADERANKEELEQQVDNLKQILEKLQEKRSYEYEKYIRELQHELTVTKEVLQASEDKIKEPQPLLLQLQEEMKEMKKRHHQAVEQESKRANEAEEQLKTLAFISEERAASLEARLSELSQMVGNYDRLRQQDLVAIQKLKDRVTQLDLENSTLARTIAGGKRNCFDFENDSNLDVQTLMDRITRLKGFLHLAKQRSKMPTNIAGGLNEAPRRDESNSHSKCEKELLQLKEEFEQYKLSAQSIFKENNIMDAGLTEQLASLRKEVASLKEELQTCKLQLESAEEYHQNVKMNLQHSIQEIKLKHKQEMLAQESEYQAKLLEQEQQLQKQRERSLILLEEKEKEIAILKSSEHSSISVEEKQSSKRSNRWASIEQRPSQSLSEAGSVTDLFSSALISSKNGGQLLHYSQEMARKDVEISNLRRSRLQAETALRDVQQTLLVVKEKYQDEISVATSQIKRLESCQSNECVNMEYLKNVVLRFVKCQDATDRTHMLNAISAVLHFTPRELQEVKGYSN